MYGKTDTLEIEKLRLRIQELEKENSDLRLKFRTVNKSYLSIKRSLSYKLGRGLTCIPRFIWNFAKNIHKNGVKIALSDCLESVKQEFVKWKRFPPYRMLYLFVHYIWNGYRQYALLLKEYGEDAYIHLSAGGTGDVYISNLYYNRYIELKGRKENAVYVLPGESCYQTTKLFDITRAKKIEKERWIDLLHLFRFLGEKSVRIDMLYYHIFVVHTGYVTWLESYKGWNLYRLMHAIHFSDLTEKDIERPKFHYDKKRIVKIFFDNKLKLGKTVILSPYAKWPPAISSIFWENLVDELKKKGYTVCTNSIGESEPPIKGTKPVFYSYDLAVPMIEAAGYMIGLRSGFLDIIESAEARKVALYPYNCKKRGIADGTAIGSFSLNEMFGRNDFLELEISDQNMDEIINMILEYFE